MGIEIKKRDCTIHRRIGSAAQPSKPQRLENQVIDPHEFVIAPQLLIDAHTHTHKSVDGREELESLSPADRKRGEEVDGEGGTDDDLFCFRYYRPSYFQMAIFNFSL
jgi:hypothetical protein